MGKTIRNSLAQIGEPLLFGIKERMVEEFLIERGFSKVCNVTSEYYKRAYFHGANKDREVCNLLSFVHVGG